MLSQIFDDTKVDQSKLQLDKSDKAAIIIIQIIPNEIVVLDYFETTKPYKLEKMLHNHFKSSNELNEWFRLDKENVKSFKKTCQHYQDIIDALIDNPFF